MNNQSMRIFGVAAFVGQCLISVACSSGAATTPITGGGGVSGGGGSNACVDHPPTPDPANPGSCIVGTANADYMSGGACAPVPGASTSNGIACNHDCCVPCGIDMLGAKTCTCPSPGAPYNNCSCVQPCLIPTGLTGGPCMPQGYSGGVPADAAPGSISLVGQPCKIENASKVVCFTQNSIASSERGCICLADSAVPANTIAAPSPTGAQLHCASVNHWFINNGTPTPY